MVLGGDDSARPRAQGVGPDATRLGWLQGVRHPKKFALPPGNTSGICPGSGALARHQRWIEQCFRGAIMGASMRSSLRLVACLVLGACASAPRPYWTRTDGGPIMTTQWQSDTTICRGDAQKANASGVVFSGGGLAGAVAASNRGQAIGDVFAAWRNGVTWCGPNALLAQTALACRDWRRANATSPNRIRFKFNRLLRIGPKPLGAGEV
jgi:hypothetical protein